MRVTVDIYRIQKLIKEQLKNEYDITGTLANMIVDDIGEILQNNEDD